MAIQKTKGKVYRQRAAAREKDPGVANVGRDVVRLAERGWLRQKRVHLQYSQEGANVEALPERILDGVPAGGLGCGGRLRHPD